MLQQMDLLFACSQPCIVQMDAVADRPTICMLTLYYKYVNLDEPFPTVMPEEKFLV